MPGFGGYAMFYGVLHQRLNGQQRNGGSQNGFVDIQLGPQFRAQPQFLNLQVGANDLQLFFDLDERPIGAKEITKDIGQVQYQSSRFGVASIDRPVERVERVE